MKELLSGNEAIARGAWEYGIELAAAYPGTPSTEILETLARMPGVYAEWCPNEKVALDVAIGAAYAGASSMAVMKHVGVNVAADALFYGSMMGVEGACVLVSADDPGMHSSQNEQDNRRYAKFARVPCLEPTDSQSAKEMMAWAIKISHEMDTIALYRTTTRISHSSGLVELGERQPPQQTGPREYRVDRTKYIAVPGNARLRHPIAEERIHKLAAFAETFAWNRVEMGDRRLGIVTNGVAYQYGREVFPNASFLVLGMTYPVPAEMIREFAAQVEDLLVLEELDPCIEEEIRLLGIPVRGKEIFPLIGELSPAVVRDCAVQAGLLPSTHLIPFRPLEVAEALPQRPPILCPGCPHRGAHYVAHKLDLVVNGDIGCYTLSYQPPLEATDTCGCMGASIGVGHGVAKIGITRRNVAAIGDSTFFHTGMPALLNVSYNKSSLVTLILDNRTTAMTGHQDNPGTGKTAQGEDTIRLELEPIVRAMGIDQVYTVDPYDLAATEEAFRRCLDSEEPAVVIARRECALLPEVRRNWRPLRVDTEACIACGRCMRVGCPALSKSQETNPRTGRQKAQIDALLCTGCEICAQVCPQGAILTRARLEEAAT